MKSFCIALFMTITNLCFSQTKQCACPSDSLITLHTTSCKTTYLKDRSKLYYQFNCDSIWLTLENQTNKFTIFSMTTEFYPYTYRLGYQLAHEYEKVLLFRSGCAANGPCNFVLVDKKKGTTTKELGELIYDHAAKDPFFDFILYFTNDELQSLTLHYINSNKKYTIPVNQERFNSVMPEYQFTKIAVENNKLILTNRYNANDKWLNENLSIDLAKYIP